MDQGSFYRGYMEGTFVFFLFIGQIRGCDDEKQT